jgi:hypothetical protein
VSCVAESSSICDPSSVTFPGEREGEEVSVSYVFDQKSSDISLDTSEIVVVEIEMGLSVFDVMLAVGAIDVSNNEGILVSIASGGLVRGVFFLPPFGLLNVPPSGLLNGISSVPSWVAETVGISVSSSWAVGVSVSSSWAVGINVGSIDNDIDIDIDIDSVSTLGHFFVHVAVSSQ